MVIWYKSLGLESTYMWRSEKVGRGHGLYVCLYVVCMWGKCKDDSNPATNSKALLFLQNDNIQGWDLRRCAQNVGPTITLLWNAPLSKKVTPFSYACCANSYNWRTSSDLVWFIQIPELLSINSRDTENAVLPNTVCTQNDISHVRDYLVTGATENFNFWLV